MRIFRGAATLIIGLSLLLGGKGDDVWAQDNFSVSPITKNGGEKWRIGYYEGGEYIEYQQTLRATLEELMGIGWIEPAPLPDPVGVETTTLWNWLATEAQSDYLEFVADAHYTANWDGEVRQQVAQDIIDRLNTQQDIDLMMAMGTWAGQDLANDAHHTPTIVLAVSDALAAGIVKSYEDSGHDHIHARVDPLRYERQVRIFQDIIGFQTLGVAYKNDIDGRSYAAIDKVEQVAEEVEFEVVSCYIEVNTDIAIEEEEVKQCFRELATQVDAIYVTIHRSINANTIGELVDIAISHRIPTFSQAGSEEVKYGVLLSISQVSFKYVGQFYAETIAKILTGAQPRQLEMVFEDPPKIAINLKTAELIGYDPPVDVLGVADEIYQEILTP